MGYEPIASPSLAPSEPKKDLINYGQVLGITRGLARAATQFRNALAFTNSVSERD